MGEMENSVEFFYEKLKDTKDPGPILVSLFSTLYSIPEISQRSILILCRKLVKIFGRFTVFFAIVDMAGTYPEFERLGNIYPLVFTICKRRFEMAHIDSMMQSYESLEGYVKEINKLAEKAMRSKKEPPSNEGL
jgi:hypothetical protein